MPYTYPTEILTDTLRIMLLSLIRLRRPSEGDRQLRLLSFMPPVPLAFSFEGISCGGTHPFVAVEQTIRIDSRVLYPIERID